MSDGNRTRTTRTKWTEPACWSASMASEVEQANQAGEDSGSSNKGASDAKTRMVA
jgi:hypothetical protein